MREKTLRKFLFSHVIIELIVLTTIIPFAVFAMRSALDKQVDAAYNLAVSDISSISSELQAAEDLISRLHRYADIKQVIAMRGELSGVDYYHAAQARSLWYSSTMSWDLLRDNYVFFSKNDVVFSPQRIFFSPEEWYAYWMHYEDLSFDEWNECLRSDMANARRTFRPAAYVYTYERGVSFNAITYLIPFTDAFNSGMAVCLIGTDDLLEALRLDDRLPDSFLCLYAPDGTLLYSHQAPYAVTAQEKSVASMRINRAAYQVFTIEDSSSGLVYILGTPNGFFLRGFTDSFSLLFVYTILALLVASFMSAFFAYRQYTPVKQLYALLKQSSSTPPHAAGKDEYQYFLDSYMELIRSNQTIRQTIASYDAALTTRAFEDLICGRYASSRDLEKLAMRVKLPARYRACVAILESQNKDVDAAVFSVISVDLVELLSKSWREAILMHPLSEKRLLFVIPTESDGSAISIAERLNGVIQSLRRDTGVEVYFAVSDVYRDADQLTGAYEEAKCILACRHSLGEHILFPEDVEKTDAPPLLTATAAAKLREYVLAGDATRSSEFMLSYLESRYLRDRDYSQLFFSLRGILMQISADGADALPFYSPDTPRDEQTAALVDACVALSSSFSGRKKSHNDQLKNGLIAYLEENYSDPDIYGKSVAAHFGISEKYLYTFFKEQTGVSFASYLETLRLNQAVELLTNSRFTVNEIAQMVGFNSPNTFYKAFRRVYGASPSVYRSMIPRA